METPMQTIKDSESTISSEEPLTTQELDAYPALPIQKLRDGPIEEIAVHYVRINRAVEHKAVGNTKQEDNVRSTELVFMLDLDTLINGIAADPDLIELQRCLERKTI